MLLKIRKRIVSLLLFLVGMAWTAYGQPAPKREFRAAWIATVDNIDWPSRPGLSSQQQQQEFIRLLDTLQRAGMNAVIVQIRPCADAFYPSSLEPWSYWLSGHQGDPPQPAYDPLQFMIHEAHLRGMEFQAWFNPYRAVFDLRKPRGPGNITRRRPQWFLTYGRKMYFNPGIPEVWDYLVRVVSYVVKHYNIDGVHFDDYFYPYRIIGREFPDYRTYEEYGKGMALDSWRRHNVDTVIKMVSHAIKAIKPWVSFGISPFGVWRNQDRDPGGSDTHAGQTDYDDLYADVLLWLKKGWIDYVAPQLYWDFSQHAAPYGVLLDWWAHHTYGRQLYIGQGLYRVGSPGAWRDPAELPDQLIANRSYPQVSGSIFYSASVFYRDTYGLDDSLRNHFYRYPALLPLMPWLDSLAPEAPRLLSALPLNGGLQLSWMDTDTSAKTTGFVVYRFPGDTIWDLDNPAYILKILKRSMLRDSASVLSFTDSSYRPGEQFLYTVTALDRMQNESDPGGLILVPSLPVPPLRELPGLPSRGPGMQGPGSLGRSSQKALP